MKTAPELVQELRVEVERLQARDEKMTSAFGYVRTRLTGLQLRVDRHQPAWGEIAELIQYLAKVAEKT